MPTVDLLARPLALLAFHDASDWGVIISKSGAATHEVGFDQGGTIEAF